MATSSHRNESDRQVVARALIPMLRTSGLMLKPVGNQAFPFDEG